MHGLKKTTKLDWTRLFRTEFSMTSCNQLQPVLVYIIFNNTNKNPCKNSQKTMILWYFTYIFLSFNKTFWDVLSYFAVFTPFLYIYIISYQIFASKIHQFYVYKVIKIVFLSIFDCFFEILVQTSLNQSRDQLQLWSCLKRPKNQTGLDWTGLEP